MTKIMKGGLSYNSLNNIVTLTQAEYDTLSSAQKNNGTIYLITDGNPSYINASNTPYDNTSSGLSATNVQDAIDEVNNKIDWVLIDHTTGNNNWIDISNYDQLYFQLLFNNGSIFSVTYLRRMFDTTIRDISLGNYGTSYGTGKATNTGVRIQNANWAGTDVTSTTQLYVYGRK